MDTIHKEASEILERELKEKWGGWTYETIRSYAYYGYANLYLRYSADYEQFTSSAKIDVMLELARLDLQKGTTIPELIIKCCKFLPKKEAIEKLIELGKQNETDEQVAKSALEFQDHEGYSCLTGIFDLASKYRNRNNGKFASGPMLRDIEESCFYLIDLAKCFNLDLKKILHHTTKGGETLFFAASAMSETVTRRLLEENVEVNSVDDTFVAPYFRVRISIVPL